MEDFVAGAGKRDNPISDFTFFGHGKKGQLLIGDEHQDNGIVTIEELGKLDPAAFQNTKSNFYSCNTGTGSSSPFIQHFTGAGKENSFAQHWSNITGGTVSAKTGKTDYTYISYSEDMLERKWNQWVHGDDIKKGREKTGYLESGSKDYPTYSGVFGPFNGYWEEFKPEK